MAALIISISSEKSVGSRAPRVILFGAIPAIIHVISEVVIVLVDPLVAPEVGTVLVVSLAGVLDLVDYSFSSDSDPSEDSLPVFPLAPIVAPPGIRRRPETLIRTDHSLSEHTPPDTTNAHSSTPQRFIHQSLARTPRQSSLGSSLERSLDSSSPFSRPSRKRCRSPTASVPSPTYDSRSIAPTPTDLLPPPKRFRDSYSPKDRGEEQMEVDTADAEAVTDVGISDGVVAQTGDGVDPLAIGDSFESSRGGIPDLEDTIYDKVHYMSEVRIDRITEIETTQR
uniref:Uncharacterized protein n=1 Tax=Tanacetum cinerariifolium TaxID=118510 RepID=A0A699LDF3_TANCI|nr:hypothetical protein [Tanacetum cinerariifolium]